MIPYPGQTTASEINRVRGHSPLQGLKLLKRGSRTGLSGGLMSIDFDRRVTPEKGLEKSGKMQPAERGLLPAAHRMDELWQN